MSASVAAATSLSDLNREAFDDGDSPQQPDSESPFVPKPAAKSELSVQDLNLTGIVSSADKSYALISGNVVTQGERVAGYRIAVIGPDFVVLKNLDKQVTLRLRGGL